MSNLIPVDLVSALHDELRSQVRPHDGLLHASSDLVGSLRHSMLRAAGAPTLESELISDVTLMTGTFWHRYFGQLLVERGVPFMQEVKVTPWLPEGWSGTADWLFWHPEYKAFVLGDLKTSKGEAFRFLRDGGAKTEHIWQLSAYWYALEEMGIPLIRGFGILYLPKNNTADKGERVEPILHECEPLPRDEVWGEMESRWAATEKYLEGVRKARAEDLRNTTAFSPWETNEIYLNDALAPEQDRVQKLWWDGKRRIWNVKLMRHWSANYCPYPTELCACNEAPEEKIGHYHWYEGDGLPDNPDCLVYTPRKGYESIEPTIEPSKADILKRLKEANA